MKLTIIILSMLISMGTYSQESAIPNDLTAKNAVVEKAGTGYLFTEGSSVAADGRVFFTDQPNDKIYIWDEKTGISLFKESTERSNGTWFDKQGNLLTCADLHNRIIKFNGIGEKTVILDNGYEGKHFNGPNDLWSDKKGGIYFTDPYYHREYWEPGHKQLLEIEGVYYLSPAGKLVRVIDDLEKPNGIVGTSDGKFLYVADTRARITWRYTILPDGTLSEKTNFAPVGSDGMTLDKKGNVYLTSGKVHIFNNKGVKAGEITLPEFPTNLCFGGKKRNILFITARTSVYTLKMKVKGVE